MPSAMNEDLSESGLVRSAVLRTIVERRTSIFYAAVRAIYAEADPCLRFTCQVVSESGHAEDCWFHELDLGVAMTTVCIPIVALDVEQVTRIWAFPRSAERREVALRLFAVGDEILIVAEAVEWRERPGRR